MTDGASAAGAATSRASAGRDIAGQIVLRALNLALGRRASRCCWSGRSAPTGSAAGRCCWRCSASSRYFGSLGLAQVAVERAAADPDRAPHWFGALVTLRLALIGPVTLLVAGRLPPARRRRRDAGRRRAGLRGAAGVGAERAQRGLPAAGAQRRDRPPSRSATASSGPARSVPIAAARRRAGRDRRGASWPCPRSPTSPIIVLALRASPRALPRAPGRSGRRCCARACRSGIGGLLTLGYGYMDQVIVFEIAGVRDAGLYGAVYRIYERIQFLPGGDHDHAVPAVRRRAGHRSGARPAPLPHRRATTSC